jgi:hypothetical protein
MSSAALRPKLARRLRRSKRLGLSVPVKVYGKDAFGQPFREFTQMLSVSAHGGLLALAASVEKGQTILVENKSTQEEQEFRVVHVSQPHDGKWRVGIEFVGAPVDFWRIYFPPVSQIRV